MAYPISDVPRRIVYSGSAGVGPYAFTFEVLANTDIAVYKNTTLLTLTTDYTVSINTGTGTGTVTLVVAATGADTVTIVGDRAIRRTSDFVTGGDLFANTLNEELDAQTIYTQQVDEKADRAIKIPVTDPTNLSMTLPSQATRAQKLLGFNASGEPTAYVATTTVSDTSLINFTQAGTGAVTRTAQAKMRDTVSVKDFGAVGDSNGTTGNGTDDTAAIQAAVTFANATGRSVYVPTGCYRITAPINFAGSQTKAEFCGESNFNTIIFADFTSGSPVAALSLNASAGARTYVAFKNFQLKGRAVANVSGIYCNWGSEFTEIENVWVFQFYNGIVVANDYNVKITRCQTWYCLNNGIQIGLTLAGVLAPANNIMLLGCLSTYNGSNGFYVKAARTLGMVQCDGEANTYTNIYLDGVYGGSLTGTYMEYSSAEAGNPIAQLYMVDCTGVTIDGLSVSAFDNSGNPVIFLDGNNNGISLSGIAIETSGSPTSAIGLRVNNSYGITLRSSYFNALSTGLYVENNARLTIEQTVFSNCTIPVSTTGSGSKTITWLNAVDAELSASVSQIASNVKIDYSTISNQKNQINETKSFNVTIGSAQLSGGASVKLIDSVLASEQWRILDILVVGLTSFSGGNRNLSISNGTHTYTAIPSASLALATLQAAWGSANVPYSATYWHMLQPTAVGGDLIALYSGGTTDHTAGDINITIVAERIA